jgi:DNA-binding transcriptional LysR family regulator
MSDTSATPDLLLGPVPKGAPSLVMKRLGEVSWCVLARRDHPAAKKLTVAAWQKYPHVVVTTGNGALNRVAEALEAAGVRRTVGLTVTGFLAAPWVVAKTDMLLAAPRELLREIADALHLVRLRPPVALPTVPIAVMWPKRAHADAGHRWLRERVTETLLARLGRGGRG